MKITAINHGDRMNHLQFNPPQILKYSASTAVEILKVLMMSPGWNDDVFTLHHFIQAAVCINKWLIHVNTHHVTVSQADHVTASWNHRFNSPHLEAENLESFLTSCHVSVTSSVVSLQQLSAAFCGVRLMRSTNRSRRIRFSRTDQSQQLDQFRADRRNGV